MHTLTYLVLLFLLVYFVIGHPELQIKLPEDALLNTTELINKYGYKAETFEVTTEDGYILSLVHICGRKGLPVFLQHGLFGSSDDYILRGNTSLAINLAKKGYDIWLGNSRGNRYSRKHVSLNPDKDPSFFYYSFHEFGFYDTPAFIYFILQKIGQKQLSAIGYSEGTTMFYVLGATRPHYNQKLKIFIALAPICFFNHVKPPFATMLDVGPLLYPLLNSLGQQEIAGNNSLLRQIIVAVCSQPIFGYDICLDLVAFPFIGYDSKQEEPEFLPVYEYIGHFPEGTSLRNLYHYVQVRLRKKFVRYDYGIAGNILTYKSQYPPEYDLSKVSMRVALFAGQNDKLAPLADVDTLREKLSNVVEYNILKPPKFNHFDFIIGRDTHQVLFPQIYGLLSKYN